MRDVFMKINNNINKRFNCGAISANSKRFCNYLAGLFSLINKTAEPKIKQGGNQANVENIFWVLKKDSCTYKLLLFI